MYDTEIILVQNYNWSTSCSINPNLYCQARIEKAYHNHDY